MSGGRLRRTLLPAAASAVTSALVSAASLRAARQLPQTTRAPWERTNHAGDPVTLLEGPAWVIGAVAGSLAAGSVRRVLAPTHSYAGSPSGSHAAAHLGTRPGGPARPSAGSAIAAPVSVALAAGVLGALDDLRGAASSKGLKGHLSALRRGEVTTGAIKIIGLAATGIVGAALVDRGRRGPASTLLGGAVIAGAANAVNLFDLRPGRALKVTVAAGAPLVARGGAAAVGASLGVIGDDLGARSMLGDTGANAAGALVGLALVEGTGPVGRALALGGLTALTLASERISFTAVIEANPLLRRIDEWGRSRR